MVAAGRNLGHDLRVADSAAVAIVSVVAGASVAIAVPFINIRLEGRRLRHQTAEEQRKELRGLLDDAAVHLLEAVAAMVEVYYAIVPDFQRRSEALAAEESGEALAAEESGEALAAEESGRALGPVSIGALSADALSKVVDHVNRDNVRLRLRLGDAGPIVETHSLVKDQLGYVHAALWHGAEALTPLVGHLTELVAGQVFRANVDKYFAAVQAELAVELEGNRTGTSTLNERRPLNSVGQGRG